MSTLQTVHLRVNDAGTGKPTPCRIRVTDAQGNYYAPFGNLARFAMERNVDVGGNVRVGAKSFAYINGACEINLPHGRLRVEIHKGPEYRPLCQELDLPAGKLALRLEIERWIDLPSQGWYSGDTRVHFLSPHAALLEAQAEDVHVVNLLATETEVVGKDGITCPAISNIHAFSGQQPALETPGYVVAVNTFNSHPILGSLSLLHCHRPVYPLSFGGPNGNDDWSLADWCDQCHRKRGLVVWSRTAHESEDFLYGEPLADLVLGKVDAFEVDHFKDSPFDELWTWYDLLQVGLRVPLAGCSGKDSNASALGVIRTFSRLLPDQELNCSNWIEAVRGGRTFVSNGPIVLLSVERQEPGAIVPMSEPGGKLRILVECRSQIAWDRLELIFNGSVILPLRDYRGGESETLITEFTPPHSGWLAARCLGEKTIHDKPANQKVFAHTSPVYIEMAGYPQPRNEKTAAKFSRELGLMEEWARTKARCDSLEHRDNLIGFFVAARNRLQIAGE